MDPLGEFGSVSNIAYEENWVYKGGSIFLAAKFVSKVSQQIRTLLGLSPLSVQIVRSSNEPMYCSIHNF